MKRRLKFKKAKLNKTQMKINFDIKFVPEKAQHDPHCPKKIVNLLLIHFETIK